MSEKIDALLEQRGQSWGNAAATHARIAQVWSGILDTEVTAGQVALCMTGLKLVRASVNPGDPDSFDDGHGYLAIAEDIYGHNNLAHEAASTTLACPRSSDPGTDANHTPGQFPWPGV